MFYYDENRMADMLSLVTKNIGEVHGMEDGYLENMEPISNTGVYGNGVQMIDSQIVAIKDGLTDFKTITTNNSNAIIELEKRLTKEVENIVLPKDFDADDTGYTVELDSTELSKNDGTSIDSNNETVTSNLEDNYTEEKENIYSLKEEKLDNKEIEDYYAIDEKTISKFKEEDLKQNNIEDYYGIDEEVLHRLKEEDLKSNELEDYSVINNKELARIKKDYLEEVEYDNKEQEKESVGDKDDNKS